PVVAFRRVQMPEISGLRFSLELFHDRDVALHVRVAAESRPAFPAAALEYIGRDVEHGLQGNYLLADKLLDLAAQFFFFGTQAEIHGFPAPPNTRFQGVARPPM